MTIPVYTEVYIDEYEIYDSLIKFYGDAPYTKDTIMQAIWDYHDGLEDVDFFLIGSKEMEQIYPVVVSLLKYYDKEVVE